MDYIEVDINSLLQSIHTYALRVKLKKPDWTKTTKSIGARFYSYKWSRISRNYSLEHLLVKRLSKNFDPLYYFSSLVDMSLINEIIYIREVYSNVFSISFIGPYPGTVRQQIIESHVTSYESSISSGIQTWNLSVSNIFMSKVVDKIMQIAKIISIDESNLITHGQNAAESINNDALISILSDQELRTLKIAMELGYFKKNRSATISTIGQYARKNKSTIDRQLNEALNKILCVLLN